jgi:FixJ family two-component response regulator
MTQAHISVILIEDDDAVREAITSLLRSSGAAVVSFASAEEFLGSACREHVGCLIVDVNLRGMSGFDLYLQLPATHWRGVPVIFVTARADSNGRMQRRAMQLGAHAFLYKPFLGEALMAAVRSAPVG